MGAYCMFRVSKSGRRAAANNFLHSPIQRRPILCESALRAPFDDTTCSVIRDNRSRRAALRKKMLDLTVSILPRRSG